VRCNGSGGVKFEVQRSVAWSDHRRL